MIQLICAFGAFQLVLISAAFAFSQSRPRRMLASLAGVLAAVIGGAAFMDSPVIRMFPHAARLHVPFNFAIAPLFYYLALTVLEKRTPRHSWLHAIPAIGCAMSLAPFYALDGQEKLEALMRPDAANAARLVALLVQGAVYIAMTLRLVAPHRLQHRTLWLASTSVAGLWAVCIFRLTGTISPLVVPAGFSGCAALVVVSALRSHDIQRAKYARSTLREPQSDRLLERLTAFFDTEKPYLSAELTLESVAERLSLSPHHLSQTVNQRLGRNFNDWVNSYRIEEARRLLGDPRASHLSIAGIGDAAGFGSKSTFNAAFKKFAGMTPSEFRRRRPES